MFVELAGKRSYNSSHLLKVVVDENGNPILNEQGELVPLLTSDGKKQMKLNAHAGHIHYKDGEEFKPLDWTLLWDEIRRGWYFETHSYNPFIPEYSDGWAEFRDRFHDKDQTVKYKAIVQNIVKGELIETDETNPNFDDNIDNKGVLYRNAFGENRDYMLYNTRSSLVKVATVNNPNECTADAVFEWEVEFPDKELFRVDKKEDAEDMTRLKTKTNTEDGKLVGYKLENRDGKNLNTNKLTLIGNSNLDGKEWYTYLKSFKAWDSEGNTIEIVARVSFVNGKAILKKTIPLEFLKNAVGRVFTDTTTSYYASSCDDSIYYDNANWATCRGASSGTLRTGTAMYFQGRYTGTQYTIERCFFTFNTAGIPDTDTVSAATFHVYGNTRSGTNTVFKMGVYGNTQASDTAIAAGDFDQIGRTALSDTVIELPSFSTTAYNSFALNSGGISAVNKTGYTKLSLTDVVHDAEGATPPTEIGTFCSIKTSETTGTSQDPYLSVTYSAGASPAKPALLFSLIS